MKNWKKPVSIAGITLGVILAIGLGFLYQTDIPEAASHYNENLAKAKQQGLFLTIEDLKASLQQRSKDNAADILGKMKSPYRELETSLEASSTKQFQLEKAKLDHDLPGLEQASRCSTMIYPSDWTTPVQEERGGLVTLKLWQRALVVATEASSKAGDLLGVERYLQVSIPLALLADSDGQALSTMIRAGLCSNLERVLFKILSEHYDDAAWVDLVSRSARQLDQPYNWHRMISTEFATLRAESLAALQNPSAWLYKFHDPAISFTPQNDALTKYGRLIPRLKTATEAHLLGLFADADADLPADPYDLPRIESVMSKFDSASKKPGASFTFVLTGYMTVIPPDIEMELARRNILAQTLAMVKERRSPSQGLPLKDRHRMDMDGKDLRLKKTTDGWIIYSVWTDKVDGGGNPHSPGGGGPDDLVVPLPFLK